jgi:hypothetical protein
MWVVVDMMDGLALLQLPPKKRSQVTAMACLHAYILAEPLPIRNPTPRNLMEPAT